ncbi:Carbonic anhydrase 2-like 2 [Homarus americanus]|uniref:Carbonic anhydrase n=1 Tax=Homarus americanus TaxID=6706 RepID=A0A8J5K4T7_HOMAM|nr:Carbonic anhydrase 2-like 2 [Homarus americanus]
MMTLMNNGHAAQVMISQDPAPTVQGGDLEGKYTFLQFHFHWGGDDSRGSEHTVDGKQYPAELHLVHFKSEYGSVAEAVKHEDGLAVLGVLIDVSSEDNNKLVSLIDGLAKIHEPESHEDITPFPLKDLLPDNVDDFYRYDGSLTTPPCNEIVIWTVFKEPISMSSQQLNEFRKLIDEEGAQLIDNFRPVQPIGDRMVFGDSLTPHWSYTGETGPENWPKFFPICGGDSQSPVNIETANAQSTIYLPFLFTNYNKKAATTSLMNNGHTAQVNFDMLDGLPMPSVIGGGLQGSYTFLQFHLHWGADDTVGSEHTVDGKSYAGELHLVHFKTEYGNVAEAIKHVDGIAVLGVFLEATDVDNPNLWSLIEGLPSVIHADTHTTINSFPLLKLLPQNLLKFYRYSGSLTTPTCNEIVIWTVFRDPITISSAQLAKLRMLEEEDGKLIKMNFRPVQPLNGRQYVTRLIASIYALELLLSVVVVSVKEELGKPFEEESLDVVALHTKEIVSPSAAAQRGHHKILMSWFWLSQGSRDAPRR